MDDMPLTPSEGFTAINDTHDSSEAIASFRLYPDQNDPSSQEGSALQKSLEDVGLAEFIDDFVHDRSISPDDSETLKPTSEADASSDNPRMSRYSYDTIVDEAREVYAHAPPFCTRDRGEKTKLVQDIITREEIEMQFRKWPDAKGYGY